MRYGMRWWLIAMGVVSGSMAIGWTLSERRLVNDPRPWEREGTHGAGSTTPPPHREDAQFHKEVAALRRDLERLSAEVVRNGGSGHTATPAGSEVAALRRGLERLSAEVARMQRQGHKGKAARLERPAASQHAAELDTAEEEADVQATTQAVDHAEANREVMQHIAAIEADFRSETPDPAWANQASEVISQALVGDGDEVAETAEGSESLSGSSVSSMECRATLCRVEVTHTDSHALMNFMHNFPSMVGGELPRMTVQPIPSQDGTVTTVVYLSRQGH